MVLCYLARVLLDWRTAGLDQPDRSALAHSRTARLAWTAGCGLYLLHVLSAFALVHHWSHVAAYEHTADRTAAVVGWRWGGGLYINYAFTLLWLADTTAWWVRGRRWPPTRSYFWMLQAVFALMMFNATVVFGPALWRRAALIGAAAAAIGWAVRRGRQRCAAGPMPSPKEP